MDRNRFTYVDNIFFILKEFGDLKPFYIYFCFITFSGVTQLQTKCV
jgi:hypothetical protein